MSTPDLIITNLHVSVDDKPVLNGIDLTIRYGEIHAIMGPNGSGKTTLSAVIMGHPKYHVEQGEILFRGQNVVKLPPHQRAQLGLFLAFQYPKEIPGVKLLTFLRSIHHAKQQQRDPLARKIPVAQFKILLQQHMTALGIDQALADRYLNTGFSGGEKKKSEMLQLALLEPDLAVLDETDSGLDIDALRLVCRAIQTVHAKTGMGVLLITHYNRILDYITPDYVHVLMSGRIVRSGGPDFAKEVEDKGYNWLRQG